MEQGHLESVVFQIVFMKFFFVQTKRLKRQELFAREGLTWAKVIQFFTEQLEKKEQQRESQELKNLLKAAKQIGIVFHRFLENSCILSYTG